MQRDLIFSVGDLQNNYARGAGIGFNQAGFRVVAGGAFQGNTAVGNARPGAIVQFFLDQPDPSGPPRLPSHCVDWGFCPPHGS
jgi:hypothetical protein